MSYFEPYAEQLTLDQPLPEAPAITLDEGLAWQYQSICGDALRLPLSEPLSLAVTGRTRLVNPALVIQVAIGQSTVATRRVIANLFYRNVRLHKQLCLGSTIRTRVTPIAAELARPGTTGPRAKVLLSIVARDQNDEVILEFERLALVPVSDADAFIASGSVGEAAGELSLSSFESSVPQTWDPSPVPAGSLASPGVARTDPLSEPVEDALALVRITQNLAAAHRDVRRGQRGRRLVYGGHTVGLAQAALSRADPSLLTVLGWHSCDHTAPVFEQDLLTFTVTLLEHVPSSAGGSIAAYRVEASVERDGEQVTVLSWIPVVWTAATDTEK